IVKRFELAWLGEQLAVGADVVAGPDDAARLQVESLDPSADAEFATGRADEQVVYDFAVGVERAAIDRVAAGDADCVRRNGGAILPRERVVGLRQVER